MKRKLLTHYFLFITIFTFSQFNVIVEDSTNNHIYSHILKDTINNISILNGSTDNMGNRGISIIKTDSLGDIINEVFYSKNGELWYEGYSYSSIFYKNKTISILQKENNISIPCIIAFNNNYDSLYSKAFIFDTLGAKFFGIQKTYSNGIILAGQKSIGAGDGYAYLLKINSSNDTIWSKIINDQLDNMLGNKIIETYDSSLISIGFTFIGNSIYKQDWYILKTDSLGNLKWWLHPGNPNLNDGSAADIIQTKDSCYVVVGGKAVYRDANGEKFDGHIMKIDRNGNILWDKTYRKRLLESPYDSVYCFFNSIVELDDGGFIVAANEQIQMGGGHYNSVLYLFDSNGDTLKTKHYCTRCEYTTGGIPTQEFPTTIKKIDDGSFLIGGWGTFVYIFNHPYEQQMFLIKTDQFGCDGTEEICDTLTTANTLKTKQQNMLLYPNPAKESITINLSENNNNKEITIYDIYGRKLKQIKYVIVRNSEAISINVSNLQSGVYILKVGENVAKFIKE
jgi:hypothetical protein